MDAKPGTGGSLPHYTQVNWDFDGSTARGSRKLVVEGVAYYMGYGDPGRQERGEYNNCLIDSMRQCLGIHSNRMAVREDLKAAFADVTHNSLLKINEHWEAILQSLFLHNSSGEPTECVLQDYCIVALCVEPEKKDHGVVVGNVRAPNRLVIMNTGNYHFDPCLPL